MVIKNTMLEGGDYIIFKYVFLICLSKYRYVSGHNIIFIMNHGVVQRVLALLAWSVV